MLGSPKATIPKPTQPGKPIGQAAKLAQTAMQGMPMLPPVKAFKKGK
jgi:hypothetical protein